MQTQEPFSTKANNWLKGSVTIKMISITILMLLLLIPTNMINSIIKERESLQEEASFEVGSKWSGPQKIIGPVLSIPVDYQFQGENGAYIVTHDWHILPDTYTINGEVSTKYLQRGIYEIIVYGSSLQLSGKFILPELPKLENLLQVKYEEAIISIGISDLKGIDNALALDWNDTSIMAKPGIPIEGINSGIYFPVSVQDSAAAEEYSFELQLELQGNENLSFTPVGNTTQVNISSTWNSPSFNGTFLPDDRTVNKEGFSAQWNILELNRNFPSNWIEKNHFHSLEKSAFGMAFIQPADNYQKSLRSSKYAVMTIALTFLAFFLVEILNKWRIHPLQYALIGLALILFYILLVSITEFTSFNIAYGISSFAIILLITLYSRVVIKNVKINLLLAIVLITIYGFVFTTLQLQDYALLIGSVGLLLILATTMYLTRKVNWYQIKLG